MEKTNLYGARLLLVADDLQVRRRRLAAHEHARPSADQVIVDRAHTMLDRTAAASRARS